MPRYRYKGKKRAHRQPPCPIVPIVGYARHASRVTRGTTRTAKGAERQQKHAPRIPLYLVVCSIAQKRQRESKTCLRTILSDYPIMPAALPVSLSEMKKKVLVAGSLDSLPGPSCRVDARREQGDTTQCLTSIIHIQEILTGLPGLEHDARTQGKAHNKVRDSSRGCH